jgi:thiol-disulfide isomerase/thioredoxin
LCPFCKETIPIWKDLVARVGMSVPIIAISLDSKDSTLAYAKNNDVSFPLAVPLDVGQFKKKNKISGVPLTLVRENTGKVLRLWLGKLDAQKALEVERSTSTDPAKEKQP